MDNSLNNTRQWSRDLLSTYQLNTNLSFDTLARIAIDRVVSAYSLLDASTVNFFKQASYHKNIDLRDDINVMLQLDNIIRELLKSQNIFVDFLQFPVNLRLFGPTSLASSKQVSYNTDILHCDHWSSAPDDSENFFLYINSSMFSTYLAFFDYERSDLAAVQAYRGSYKAAPNIDCSEFEVPFGRGVMHRWNCCLPHKTVRRGHENTVSIDFRSRPNSRSLIKDLELSDKFWSNSKMTDLGVYWFNSDLVFNTVTEKIDYELSCCEKVSPVLLEKKHTYIKKFYSEFI